MAQNAVRILKFDITKLTAELKSDNLQYINEMIYVTSVALFWWRRSMATGSSAVTPYCIDLLRICKYRPHHGRKNCSHSRSFKVIRSYTDQYGVCNFLLVNHCRPKYVSILYLVSLPLMTYSASNIGVILKSRLGVTQGNQK